VTHNSPLKICYIIGRKEDKVSVRNSLDMSLIICTCAHHQCPTDHRLDPSTPLICDCICLLPKKQKYRMNPSKTQKNKKTKEAKRKRQAKIANDTTTAASAGNVNISNDTTATSIS